MNSRLTLNLRLMARSESPGPLHSTLTNITFGRRNQRFEEQAVSILSPLETCVTSVFGSSLESELSSMSVVEQEYSSYKGSEFMNSKFDWV